VLRSVLRSRRVRPRDMTWPGAGSGRSSQGNLSPLSSSKARSGGYVSAAWPDGLRESLSERDWAILRDGLTSGRPTNVKDHP
jgi:hypothetical protein